MHPLLRLCTLAVVFTSDVACNRLRLTSSHVAHNQAPNHDTSIGVAQSGLPSVQPRQLQESPPRTSVAICAVVKGSAGLAEWLDYHFSLGVEHAYIYDNNEDNGMLMTVLQQQWEAGKLTIITAPEPQPGLKLQLQTYHHCLLNYGPTSDWLMYIDADEFILLRDPADASIQALLKDYSSFSGLGVNWIMYGTSGHIKKPAGRLFDNYHMCLPLGHQEHRHVKLLLHTALNTSLTAIWPDPHHVRLTDPAAPPLVDELKRPLTSARTVTPTQQRVALLHYVTKSREEFVDKAARGSAMGNHKTIEFLEYIDREATVNCTALLAGQAEAAKATAPSVAEPSL